MKYTWFTEGDLAWLEENYAWLKKEYARLEEEYARLEEEYARLGEEPGPPVCFYRWFEKRERARWKKCAPLDKSYARLVKKRELWMRYFAQLENERGRLGEEREWLEHARLTRFLLATAVRLLPQSERARYLEEFRAQLLDVPHNTRLSHALSLLRGVFVLRLRRGLRKEAVDATVSRVKD